MIIVTSDCYSIMGCRCTLRQKSTVAMVAGVVLVAIGVGMDPLVKHLIHSQIEKRVILKNGTEFYKLWTDIPFPIYMQFYLFDLVNPEEVNNGGKPYVIQRGPYTYREYRIKENLTENKNGTLTFKQRKYWKFIRSKSIGDENDTITTPNIVLLSLVDALQWETPAVQKVISLILTGSKESLFFSKTVGQLLWGYTDTLLSMGQKFDKSWFYTNIAGYFAGKNNSYDGTYTVFTGENDVKRVGLIDKFNGTSTLSYWTTPWANMINGTDGTIAPPFIEKDAILRMFSTDVCRSVYGVYSGTTLTPQGIQLYRYSSSADELANSSVNPDNLGFCTPQSNCLPSGLLNISQCQLLDSFHGPVMVSFPHFYLADPELLKTVDGLSPNPDWHRTDIDVEPYTGSVLQAFKRLQINLNIKPIKNIKQLAKVRNLMLPVFWINESAVVDDKTASMLRTELFTPVLISHIIQYTVSAIGGFICVVVVLLQLAIYQEIKLQKFRSLTGTIQDDERTRITN